MKKQQDNGCFHEIWAKGLPFRFIGICDGVSGDSLALLQCMKCYEVVVTPFKQTDVI